MKTTVSQYQFMEEFKNYNRENNFSYEGLKALYDWYEAFEQDTGEEIELDVIAICCEWSEYDTLKDVYKAYKGYVKNKTELGDKTIFLELSNKHVLIQAF